MSEIYESSTRKRRDSARAGNFGFTLIELVVAIAIIGLLLGALLTPLATQVKVRKNREAGRALDEVQEALVGFAVTNGRLPCPDTDSTPDGVENTGSPCSSLEGILPWITLGIDATDTWGRLYRYRVSQEFAYPVQTGTPPAVGQLDLSDAGTITVMDRASDKSQITLTGSAAAVVVSLGANGYGGRDLDDNALVTPSGDDEQTNVNSGSATFVRRGHSPGAASCDDDSGSDPFCEYDDLVKWLPEALLKTRMVEAGRLP